MTIYSRIKGSLAAVVLTVLLPVTPVLAGEAEINAARSVIDSQIRAFLSDDNATAYSFASPTIKQMFPSVEAFMNMVTGAYRPVWKPQAYTFGKSVEPDGSQVVQQVLVTGPDGKDYEAVYTLMLQDDGTYKITGVHLRKAVTAGA